MVTLITAENALKTVYLGVVSNQLNINANPLLGAIKQSTSDVWGNEIRKLAPFGINGGFGAGTEDGKLPAAGSNKYVQFVSQLKNLYGTIELTDKAIRASANNSGAFVNLLNAEMEGLIKASSFNFGRMLYGDGTGFLTDVLTHSKDDGFIVVKDTRNLIEGMKFDVFNRATGIIMPDLDKRGVRISSIDRKEKKVYYEGEMLTNLNTASVLVVQGSYNNEITGLAAIFGDSGLIYGVDQKENAWLRPGIYESVGAITDIVLQTAIDELEEHSGSAVNFITCSSKVKRAYQEYLNAFRRNIDVMDLAGGYKAISYNGIPLMSDRFVAEDTMYLLNTKEFTLHQLCDWQWLEGEDGKIIRQTPGYPTYTATLVKYADLICDRPNGQAKLTGITV